MYVRVLMLSMLMSSPAVFSAAIAAEDPHSFTNAAAFRTTHIALDLTADFSRKRLVGHVDLTLDRLDEDARVLVLDTRDLTVRSVELRGADCTPQHYRTDPPITYRGSA